MDVSVLTIWIIPFLLLGVYVFVFALCCIEIPVYANSVDPVQSVSELGLLYMLHMSPKQISGLIRVKPH